MKTRWMYTIFGMSYKVKVPDFVIEEVSTSKFSKHYMATRDDGIQVSMIEFTIDGETRFESAIKFNGGILSDDLIKYHESRADMFDYAVKIGNREISINT
jgi:hypothetical protein